MEEEQQAGCTNPIIMGPLLGGGCAVLLAIGVVATLLIYVITLV
ncbi:MAG: hypothetical protein AAFV98_14785 [Chloroflexota bacterium]